ncbi:hypothetical protein BGZ68_006943 [Mortierella alpina]|nr:hypothetical protein BGZ68_006943 [Mortierella alpina]
MDVYRTPAVELYKEDGNLKRKASECRERAETLKQKLDGEVKTSKAAVVPWLGRLAIAQATTQARVDRLPLPSTSSSSSSSSFTVSSVTTSSAIPIKTRPPPAGNTPSTPRQLPPSARQTVVSVSAASGVQTSQSLFSKDVSPVPYICQLPRPNEALHSTRQLAYCLALLKASVHNDDLSSEKNLKWRSSTLNNLDEKDRLKTLAVQIIREFAGKYREDANAVAEVVELAPVLSNDYSRFLLKTFINSIDQPVMDLHSMDGLAKVIQGAAPGSIDSNDFVSILRSLHEQLQPTHSESHRYRLLLAVSRVLDAMADAQVGDVDRVSLHGPLTNFLRESESSENPYLAFQAAYATQALLNVSDNENIWQAARRRLWLVLKGGAAFAKMPDLREAKDALEGVEIFCKASKRGAMVFKKAMEAIKTQERPTFTVKEGFKFKKVWYCNLRIAECYIQTGKLVQFKTLVATTKCKDHPMFQRGICQLLGRFAVDTQWDSEARKEALAFLGELYKVGNIWERQKKTDQVIFDVLTDLAVNYGMRFEITNTLLDKMKRHNTALNSTADLHFKPWHNRLHSDPAEHTTSKFTLLKVVQNRNRRHAKQENQPDHPPQPKLEDLQAALKTYYASHLHILRVSGEELPLETCFVNLAIVEAPAQREKDKQSLKEQAAVFHRISSFEKLEHTNMQSSIPLDQLFDKRMLRNGNEGHPRTILVQGRAGIGKTTLCKKIVHLHQTGLWRDRFDAVLWLPLRQLKAFKPRSLEDLFREKFFSQGLDQEGAALALALAVSAKQGRVLFVLDGLDEIAKDARGEEGFLLKEFVKNLLKKKHVVITSRPSGLNRSLLPQIDLELETIGFSQQDVASFVIKVLEPEPARAVQDFIQQTPMIQGLVNVPVQLDVICLCWDSFPKDGRAVTMTGLYQLMVRKLWCKDALRLGKTAGGETLTQEDLSQLEFHEIDELMATEIQHLGYLAFRGLTNDHQIEFDEKDLLTAFRDLKKYHTTVNNGHLPPQLLKIMKQTSFLHTTDADLDASKTDHPQAWYFLHLTFQEYFAATWVVRHLQQSISTGMQTNSASFTSTLLLQQPLPAGMMTVELALAFVREHKYNPRYEIMWWMVAGLLEGEALNNFFSLLQGVPRDLIGSRHQQILTACVHEARVRLNSTVVATFDSEFLKWLHFEMRICRYDDYSSSMLGSQISFPEALLLWALDSVCSWRPALVRTLRACSALSDSAIQSLVAAALKDREKDVRSTAASTLGKRSRSMDSVIQSAFISIGDHSSARFSAALGFSNQFTLTASAMQSLISAVKDEKLRTMNPATLSSGQQSTLSKSTIETLISALKDET